MSNSNPSPIRVHRIKIDAKYEGEPIHEDTMDLILRHLGDDLAIALRGRHKDADQIYVAGMHHALDEEST